MAETLQPATASSPANASLIGAVQVAREANVRQSPNGVRFATFGETGVPDLDLDRILEAVPTAIVAALGANTYFFVPLTMRENSDAEKASAKSEPAMIASAYSEELGDAAICHRNVDLDERWGHGKRGVFISTRLMGDRFALSFEFFINVAHAFVDAAGVPADFADLIWKQALDDVRGETSLDAWESRNLAFGRPADAQPEAPAARRPRSFAASRSFSSTASQTTRSTPVIDEKERGEYLKAAFSDAVAMYLLSLALDFDYSELREREYPLLDPAALAARLKLVAQLLPPNPGYEFAVKYRRKA